MRRKVTVGGLREAYAFLLAIVLGAAAVLVGGPRATTWAILSLTMAAVLVASWLTARRRTRGHPKAPYIDDPQARHDSDPRVLARRLLKLLENSRPLPVLRHQLRVKKPQVNELVAAIRHANDPQKKGSLPAVLKAAEAVEEAAYRAMPVPLTDDVRLPREQVDDLVRGLRAAGA